MGLLDAKGQRPRQAAPVTSQRNSSPVIERRGEPQADREAGVQPPEVNTHEGRKGLVQWEDGKPFLHFCKECGAEAFAGYGVNTRADRLGSWYCRDHDPARSTGIDGICCT